MISVIIPIYNRSEVLARCLGSFERQAFRPLELVLVDNNSSDDSYQICLDFQKKYQSPYFQIQVLQEKKPGACAARNKGMRAAKGDYIAFFDSDDEVYPQIYSTLDAYIQDYPRAALFLFRADLEQNGKTRLQPKRLGIDLVQHLIDPLMVTHSFLLRRSAFASLPKWEEPLGRWQDLDYTTRLLWQVSRESLQVVAIDKALYRIHAGSDSISGDNYSKDAIALEQALRHIEAFLEQRPNSDDQDFLLLRAALSYKKIALASSILHEHTRPESQLAYWREYAQHARQQAPERYRPLLALEEAYSTRGGRGFWRLFSLFVK